MATYIKLFIALAIFFYNSDYKNMSRGNWNMTNDRRNWKRRIKRFARVYLDIPLWLYPIYIVAGALVTSWMEQVNPSELYVFTQILLTVGIIIIAPHLHNSFVKAWRDYFDKQ